MSYRFVPFAVLLVVASAFHARAQTLPKPVLGLVEQITRGRFHEIYLSVNNRSAFPAEMFMPAPHLPPCGQNKNASRTWLSIHDGETNRALYRHCGIMSPNDLAKFAVATPVASKPKSVYIWLNDRQDKKGWQSNTLAIP